MESNTIIWLCAFKGCWLTYKLYPHLSFFPPEQCQYFWFYTYYKFLSYPNLRHLHPWTWRSVLKAALNLTGEGSTIKLQFMYLLQWKHDGKSGEHDHRKKTVSKDTGNAAKRDTRHAHQVQETEHPQASNCTYSIHVAKLNFTSLKVKQSSAC